MPRLLPIPLMLLVVCALSLLCAAAQAPGSIQTDVQTDAKPWTGLDLNNNPDRFQFAVVSDNAGGPRPGIFAEAVAKLNLLQPEFVLGVGDYIEGYEHSAEALNVQWDRFTKDLSDLEMPFFAVPGNHDIGRPLWSQVYASRFGVAYYHFVYRNVLFLCLNTNDGPESNTGVGEQQITWLSRVLADNPDVRWTLIFQHKPLWNDQGAEGCWAQIAELLKGRKCTIFSGHTHHYLSQDVGGIASITLSTTGGGNTLRGVAFGEFDQVAWVTMTDEGPRVANLLLDGILDKDICTPESMKGLALFSKEAAITATPILLDGDPFESGVSNLTVTNPVETPMRIRVLFEPPAGVSVNPGAVSTIVPGGSRHVVDLQVAATQPIPVPEAQPILLHWTASYDSDANRPSRTLEGECRIPIDSEFAIPLRPAAPVIDGRVDDWDTLPFRMDQPASVYLNPAAWKGPQDGSFRFAVARDEEYLYVAVRAEDDEPCFDGWKYWEDFAMLWIDARASDTDDPKTAMFNVITGPQMTREQAGEYEEGQLPDGVLSASTVTDSGFEAEFAVPLSYLNERQQGDWRRVRINVSVSDFDRRDARDGVTILNWRPQWFRPGDHPRLGVFMKRP